MSTKRKILATTAIISVVAYLIYLWAHDPATSAAPQCLFHMLTGYDCPGCGSQRALYSIMHGRFDAAWRYNAAIFFAIPLAALYLSAPRQWRNYLVRPSVIVAVLLMIIVWWILRNVI